MSKLLNKINISTLVVAITLFLLVLMGMANTLISYKHAKDDMFVAVQNSQAQNLKISWAMFSQKGSFAIKDGKIYAGDYQVNGNFDIVDKIKDITGVTATVFQDDMRVSTNVLKDDGTRAVGTKLQGPAFDAIFKENKAYRGEAPILGKVYFTAYDPIKDAAGKTIGVLYVGIQKAPFEAKMWERVGEDAILSIIFVIVGGVITWLMMKKALRPIAQFEEVAEVIISKGDFSKRSGIDSQNEMGRIARSFDNLLEEIQKVLLDISEVMAKVAEGDMRQRITAEARGDLGEIKQHINNSLDRLLGTLSGIASDIHQVANSATQASSAVGQLADGAQTQANSLKELAAAVHQSSQAVAEVAKSGNNASRNVMEAAKLSNEGREQMNRLLALMGQIEQNTRKIAGINEAVAQIAAQTNMLSLNAAIEAARAGDAGKGFAVVAEEVGKLAANAGRSAGEIEALIQTAVAGVAQGVANANDTDKNIANIANSVNGISELIEAVASAMEEQQSTISEMARTIGEVDAISSQSAAAAAELTAIMGELAGIAEQSNEKIRQFSL